MATPQANQPTRFAILASGRGSNADALMQGFASGYLQANLVAVVSDRPDAPVLQKATVRGYATAVVPSGKKTREAHENELLELLAAHKIEHLLLAGYMRLLSPHFLDRFAGAILNIHPALLPDFRGMHAARRQWEAKATVVGATVHFVDAGVDTGPILLQGSIDVRGDEDCDRLAQRILTEVEHAIYPRAVRLFLERAARAANDDPPKTRETSP